MTEQLEGMLPIDVTPMTSHKPCESCGEKSVRYKARLDPPGDERVTYRLCNQCIQAIKQD